MQMYRANLITETPDSTSCTFYYVFSSDVRSYEMGDVLLRCGFASTKLRGVSAALMALHINQASLSLIFVRLFISTYSMRVNNSRV